MADSIDDDQQHDDRQQTTTNDDVPEVVLRDFEGRRVRLLTVRETLGVLHVSRSTMYRLIRAGELRAVKIGRATRFLSSDVVTLAYKLREDHTGGALDI